MTLPTAFSFDILTPIDSIYDTRLVTLIGVVIDVIGDNALITGKSPETILAESLYIANKHVQSQGEKKYMDKLRDSYPLLVEAIR